MRRAVQRRSERFDRAGVCGIRGPVEEASPGDSETERRIESLNKLLEEASALALVGTRDRGVRVTYAFDPAVDLVLVDKVQIQQVAHNLIRNAVEAMETTSRRDLAIAVTRRG